MQLNRRVYIFGNTDGPYVFRFGDVPVVVQPTEHMSIRPTTPPPSRNRDRDHDELTALNIKLLFREAKRPVSRLSASQRQQQNASNDQKKKKTKRSTTPLSDRRIRVYLLRKRRLVCQYNLRPRRACPDKKKTKK
jgi:hypothetical protein